MDKTEFTPVQHIILGNVREVRNSFTGLLILASIGLVAVWVLACVRLEAVEAAVAAAARV